MGSTLRPPVSLFAYFAWFAVKTPLFGFAQSRCFPICVHPVCGYISGLFFAFFVLFCGKKSAFKMGGVAAPALPAG
jgi:hypothetical protein